MTLLAAWLWQAVLLVLAVRAAVALFRFAPRTRHVIWWATCAAVIVLPWFALLANRPDASVTLATDVVNTAVARPPGALVWPQPPDWIVASGIGAWLGMMLLRLVHVVRDVARVHRLRRSGAPIDQAREGQFLHWLAAPASGGRRARIGVSAAVRVPCAVGLHSRPAIVLPPRFLALPDGALERLVLHEYAHLVRRDDWSALALAIVRACVGIHPAIWWIARQIERERERAADDLVVSWTGDRREYAASLVDAAAIVGRTQSWSGEPVPGALRSRSELYRRVARILRDEPAHRPLRHRCAIAFGVPALAAAVVLFASADPIVSFSSTATSEASVLDATTPPSAIANAAVSVDPVERTIGGAPVSSEFVLGAAAADRQRADDTNTARPAAATVRRARSAVGAASERTDQSRESADDVARTSLPASLFLERTSVQPTVSAPLPRLMSVRIARPDDAEPSHWDRVVHAGLTAGEGSRRTGVSIGRAFTKAGRAFSTAFRR